MKKFALFVFGAMMLAGCIDAGELTYEGAVEKAQRENKPLVVVLSAKWCAPCGELKREVITPMKANELKNAIVFEVDVDEYPELADKIRRGSTLPQVVVFYFKDKWNRATEVGKTTRERIREMLRKVKGS